MLAARATMLLGREHERTVLEATLAAARLVTLTGPGGVGKTRLASEVAGDAPFCELATATNLDHVVTGVAATLGVSLAGTRGTSDALDRLVAQAPAGLLVLDNAEQATAAIGEVCAALLGRSEVGLLVTSRAPLGRDDERVVPLAGLSVDQGVSLLEALAGPIPDVERAAAEALVLAVDGLPLALELAAARMGWLPPSAILAQIDEPRLLARPGAPGRHGGIERALAWSIDLLDAGLREVLTQLSVFEASFTVSDAQQVLAGLFSAAVTLPDGTQLVGADGYGFVLRATVGGDVLWVHQVPDTASVVAFGPQDVLVRFGYTESFTFDGTVVPAPSARGAALARLDDAGGLVWMRRAESDWLAFEAPRELSNGDIAAPLYGADPTALGFVAPPSLVGEVHLLVLDPDGEPRWSASYPSSGGQIQAATDDGTGVLWALVSLCTTTPPTFVPTWQPPVTPASCDPIDPVSSQMLLGYDLTTGTVRFADWLALGGDAYVDDLVFLSDGSLAAAVTYFDPITLLPGTADEAVIDELGPNQTDHNTLIVVLR